MDKQVRKIIKHALELIRPKGCWRKGAAAFDSSGHDCEPWSKKAKCFCWDGALRRGVIDLGPKSKADRKKLLEASREVLARAIAAHNRYASQDLKAGNDFDEIIVDWNDVSRRTHKQAIEIGEIALAA